MAEMLSDNEQSRLAIEILYLIKDDNYNELVKKVDKINKLLKEDKVYSGLSSQLNNLVHSWQIYNKSSIYFVQNLYGLDDDLRTNSVWRFELNMLRSQNASNEQKIKFVMKFLNSFDINITVAGDITLGIADFCIQTQRFDLLETLYALVGGDK